LGEHDDCRLGQKKTKVSAEKQRQAVLLIKKGHRERKGQGERNRGDLRGTLAPLATSVIRKGEHTLVGKPKRDPEFQI